MESYIWLVFVAIGVLVLNRLDGIHRSLQSTEAMMKRFLAHEGVDSEVAVEPSDRVKALALDTTNRVAAIKAYREQTGLGVREAMAVIDRLSRSKQAT